MDVINPFRTTGWKKAAGVNCTILVLLSAALIALSGIALSHGAQTALFFYSGDCNSGNATIINFALHLLINVVSTLVVSSPIQFEILLRPPKDSTVLASSNFFMQVLNSPSRDEINRAHSRGFWLDIGVSSIRNTLNLSKFKSWCWVMLALSSIPIHLLFNSTIFRTDYRAGDFHLTIATENFTKGGTYFPPGASLQFPGLDSHVSNWRVTDDCFWGLWDHYDGFDCGPFVNCSEYYDKESPSQRKLSALAIQAGKWKRLNTNECRKEYASCEGLKEHANVVLVAKKPGGWVRDDMWNLREDQTLFWDKYIPPKQANNLFFDAQCSVRPVTTYNSPPGCSHSCIGVLGGEIALKPNANTQNSGDWSYNFLTGVGEPDLGYKPSTNLAPPEPQPSALDISIDYCLAQPLESTCKVGVSPILLLLVTVFVVVKTSTAILITISLGRSRQVPLVTLGDAISSFITNPDTITIGYCTTGHEEIQKTSKTEKLSHSSVPRPWRGSKKRLAAAIPSSTWIMSYSSIVIGISVTIGLFVTAVRGALQDSCDITKGGFFPSDNSPIITLGFTLTTAVLLANSPQLLLTFCYFTYNNIFTHLQSALEWAQFGNTFTPLRVTDPKGRQLSTYRLQLPYRYSLSLMAFSIFLHWTLANTIFVTVFTGGYYFYDVSLSNASLPPDAAILVGYSPTALLTLMLVAIFLALIPPTWSSIKRLPPNIVIPGCNSLALSAACHVSRLSQNTAKAGASSDATSPPPLASSKPRSGKRSHSQDARYKPLGGNNVDLSMDLKKSDECHLEKLAQRKLRWGVIDMPLEWYTKHGYDPALVGHLGFGTLEGGGVAAPLWDHLYA
ncbi:hypothetical protein F5Y10DRAFT_273626 [Nemania abortiva]|nr:hypothetical protein F5Y10DRAFT_273626 [Nemania abortiva]